MQLTHALLAELTRALKEEGYSMGVGQHLKMQELLRKLPDEIEPERLKTLLAPVFATAPQEQTRFYQIFDKALNRVVEIQKAQNEPEEELSEEAQAELNWRWVLISLLGVVAVVIGYILWQVEDIELTSEFKREQLSLFRNDTVLLDEQFSTRTESLLRFTFNDGEMYRSDSVWGSYQIDTLNRIQIITNDTIGEAVDSLIIKAIYPSVVDSIHLILSITNPEEQKKTTNEPEITEEKPQKIAARLKTKPIPFPHVLPRPDYEAEQKKIFWEKYKWYIRSFLIFLMAAILAAYSIWKDRKQGKDIAEIQEAHQGPPYIWEVNLEEPEEMAIGFQARNLSSRLRRRQREDYHKIDISATIKATARKAGLIDLQYSQPSRPSEYVFLIDRHAVQDHRALLFDDLYRVFSEEEVFITRFFYDGNPKVLFNEKYPNGIRLKEVQHQFADARLIIFGDGRTFFNPVNGKFSKSAKELLSWKARGLLSPQPLKDWSVNEDRLALHFFVLPASLGGIEQLIEQFELEDPRPWEESLKQVDDAIKDKVYFKGNLIETLQFYFPRPMVNWIAACAIYPQLQWKLTLHLGKELSDNSYKLLTVENILQLVRLPWFVDGKIPDAARFELIAYLKEQQLEQPLRKTIKQLLEKAVPPGSESVAFEKYKINKLFNDWKIEENPASQRHLRREIKRYLAAGFTPDAITEEDLEKRSRLFNRQLPGNLQEWLYKDGDPNLGVRPWVGASLLWLLIIGIIFLYQPRFNICPGKIIEIDDQETACLKSTDDYLIYHDYMARKLIREEAAVDSALYQVNLARRYEEAYIIYPNYADTLGDSSPRSLYSLRFPSVATAAGVSEMFVDEYTDSLRIINALPPDDRPHALGDQFMENVAVAWYNKGVQYFNSYLDIKEDIVDVQKAGLDSLLDAAALQFIMAKQMHTRMPEVFIALNRVYRQNDEVELPETIQGTVQEAGSENPLAGVAVNWDTVTVLTNADGTYQLPIPEALDEQLLSLYFSKSGYEAQSFQFTVIDRFTDEVPDIFLRPQQSNDKGKNDKRASQEVEIFDAFGLQGLRIKDGPTLVQAIYNFIEKDDETGLYRVQRKDQQSGQLQFGYIDEEGKVIIPIEYYELGFYNDGLVKAQREGKYGYLNSRGQTVIDLVFYDAEDFEKGAARVSFSTPFTNTLKSFSINKNGKCIQNCPYENAIYTIEQLTCSTSERNIQNAVDRFETDGLWMMMAYYSKLEGLGNERVAYDFLGEISDCQVEERDRPRFTSGIFRVIGKAVKELSASNLMSLSETDFILHLKDGLQYSPLADQNNIDAAIQEILKPFYFSGLFKLKTPSAYVSVYFDNGQPKAGAAPDVAANGQTLDQLTAQYLNTRDQVLSKLQSGKKFNPKESAVSGRIEAFFDNQVNGQLQELDQLIEAVQESVNKNQIVSLEMRTYTSSSVKSVYDLQLGKRRVDLVMRYLKNFLEQELSNGQVIVSQRSFEEAPQQTNVVTNPELEEMLSRRVEVEIISTEDGPAAVNNETKKILNRGQGSSIAFSFDNNFVIVANNDGTLEFHNVRGGEIASRQLRTGTGTVRQFEFLSSNSILLVDEDYNLKTIDQRNGKTFKTYPRLLGQVLCFALSGNKEQALLGGNFDAVSPNTGGKTLADSYKMAFLNLNEGKSNPMGPTGGIISNPPALALSPDGEMAAFSRGNRVELWDVKKENFLRALDYPGKAVTQLAFSRGENYLAVCGTGAVVRIYKTLSGNLLTALETSTQDAEKIGFSPTKDQLFTINNNQVSIWNLKGDKLYGYSFEGKLTAASWAGDGRSIAILLNGRSIEIIATD